MNGLILLIIVLALVAIAHLGIFVIFRECLTKGDRLYLTRVLTGIGVIMIIITLFAVIG